MSWKPEVPRRGLVALLAAWAIAAASVAVGPWLSPGVALGSAGAAVLVSLVLAALNAILPPVVGALRLPFTFVLGFLLVLALDALLLMLAAELLPGDIRVDSFGDALLAALLMAATSIALEVLLGTNDDETYTLRVIRRIARRQGVIARTDRPGIVYLEIDGLARSILRRAMWDGNAPALREHPHVGWLLVRSRRHGAVALGPRGAHHLEDGRVDGEDPLAALGPNAPHHLRRTDGFAHVADVMVGSFYDPELDEGCAFEELISFHGGLGGPQTRPFLLHPPQLPVPAAPIVGAAAVHDVLVGWRRLLEQPPAGRPEPVPQAVAGAP